MHYIKKIVKSSKDCTPFELDGFLNSCQKIYINGLAHTFHCQEYRGVTKTIDNVFCIHYDMWPNSANSSITRRRPNDWPSDIMLENIQSQGCDVAPVGHHDSKINDIQ